MKALRLEKVTWYRRVPLLEVLRAERKSWYEKLVEMLKLLLTLNVILGEKFLLHCCV